MLGTSSTAWNITGNTNRITAGSIAPQWSLNTTTLKSLTSNAGLTASIQAASIAAILIHADLQNSTITATTAIGSFKVLGQITNSTINGGESIQAIIVQKTVDAASHFTASALPKKVLIDKTVIDPASDPRFS